MIRVGPSVTSLFLCTFIPTALAGQNQTQPKFSDIDNIGNRQINQGSINFTSIEREIAVGRQLAAETDRQVTLLDDPIVAEYINRIGQNLVLNSDARYIPFTIKVVNSAEVNASSLPGGFVYINTGVIIAAEDEAELASVIAHQIAHVAARHSTEIASKAQLVNIALAPAILTNTYRERAESPVSDSFAPFFREAVVEADYLGVQYLYKTGYDPRAAVRFLRKLQANGPASIFRTHPSIANRIEAMEKNIAAVLPRREENVVATPEFEAIKRRVSDRR
jgi:predicted Zn-dependent protease